MSICNRGCSPMLVPLLVALFAACGCGHSRASAGATPQHAPAEHARSAPEAAAPDRAQHMQATFWMAVAARDALIAGDLASAKRDAQELARTDYSSTLPAEWKHWVAQMQQRADEVTLAPDLPSAARAIAGLALSCGECHAQMQQGPARPHEEPLAWQDPPEDVDQRMYRHEVGVDQLWLGLVKPSETAWRNGTVSLTRAPLQPVLHEGEAVSPEFDQKLEQVRELARKARAARSHEERATVYGELIAECASCHFVAGVK